MADMAKLKNSGSVSGRSRQSGADAALDLRDRKILSVLRADGRLTIAELAEKVGLSATPCWTRVKRLEAMGAISGYVAVIDARAIGVPNVVFIEVTLDKHDEKMLESFGQALAAMPEVMEAHLVTGGYDYLVKVAVTGTDHYERFLRESLYRLPGIRHSRSTFALRVLKQEVSVDPLLMPIG
jgi:Lrp/AsnC family transcriptional regulator, leucine-responsive regulatory protein